VAPYRWLLKARLHGIENRICRLARSVLLPGDAAIDVGANYGFVSTILAKSVAPGGRLFAFEINKSIAETLQRTMARNALNEVALVIGQGAGASVSQSLTTVDTLLQTGGTRNVGFIKVDTDGSDYDVLRGATKTLNASQAVVAVEMSQRQQEIFELLRS